MEKCSLLAFLLLVTAVAWGGEGDLRECALSHPRLSKVVNAQCREFQVPLDYDQPQGEKIQLHVAVVPASGKAPRADPLFFFAGGPGQSAVASTLLMWPVFAKVLQHRDLVLIDQRGTGKSTPLNCPMEASLELVADDALLRRKTRDCLERQQVDVRYFTSRQAVADVEFVRQALGYERINLMGVSYGTRMAQLVLREYPERVRSIVLDGVLPLEVIVGPDFADNLSASLQKLFFHCAAEDGCREAFPTLEEDWRHYLALSLDERRQLPMAHPRTGESLELDVSRQGLDAAVRMLSYASETRTLLPLLIHAAAQGDWRPLLGQALQVMASLEGEMSEGMHNSVVCSEDAPFYGDPPAASNRVLGRFVRQIRILCEQWPRGESFADIHQPLQSDVPALLLSGEVDPVTPISYGEQALQQFGNGRHLVVPGQGHNVLPRGCVPELAADFIHTLKLDDKDAACVQDMARLPFFIDKLGPAP